MNNKRNTGTVSPLVQNIMPVGNKKKITGYIPIENLIPIQTEKDELIVLPTNDVVKVNAKKRHGKMPEDQVTDIVPDGSYVLSQYGQVDIYKEEADNMIIETENKPYNLFSQNPEPKVKTLGDMMGKKKMKPADLARKILAKYKTVDLDDPFTEQTNRANKYTASKYLQAIVALSELDKERKGLNAQEQVDMFQGQPEAIARQGGLLAILRAQSGGEIAAMVPGAISAIGSIWSDVANRNLLKKNTRSSLADIQSTYNQQQGLENLGLGANLAGFAMQNPQVEVARRSAGMEAAALRNANLGRQEEDYAASRMAANRPDYSSLPPQIAAQLAAQDTARMYETISGSNIQSARDRANRNIQASKLQQDIANANEAARVAEVMGTRQNVGSLWAGMSGAVSGSVGNQQNLLSNKVQSQLAARNQQAQGLMQLNQQAAQNAMNTAALFQQGYNSLQNQRAQEELQQRLAYQLPTTPMPQTLSPMAGDCIKMPNGALINKYTGKPC
jgi:hypothetical protein